METNFKCIIDYITYHNDDNGYTIMGVKPDFQKDRITLVAYITTPIIGMTLHVEGQWKKHNIYGNQFVADVCDEIMPDTLYGIQKYLASGLIKGIGEKYATLIVNKFGIETPDIIENHPERLKEIPRFGEKRINTLVESWKEQKHVMDIMVFLKSFDISTLFAVKIYKLYGDNAIDVLKENPYRLITDLDGVGFKKADAIALKMGIPFNSPQRISAGIVFTLNECGEQGDTYELKSFLTNEIVNLLQIEASFIETEIDNMVNDEQLVCLDDKIFLPQYYYAEKNIAYKLTNVLKAFKPMDTITDAEIKQIETHLNIEYNEEQKNAIKTALYNNVMVLTGGPGTGKTTVTKGIITALRLQNKEILCAAPTGKAADRMSEATEMEASTIHRLLGYNPTKGYQYNEERPLYGDVLIVDEISMVNVLLMNSLLKAVPKDMKLILIGDADQLPCIGAGNILSDIISSEMIPVVKLQEIYRQAATSKIITTAHAINHGEFPDLKNSKDSDLFWINIEDEEIIVNNIIDLVKNRLPKTYGYKPTEIQVLTPMKKGSLGTINLNELLQKELNPNGEEIKFGTTTFRVNDKVMQIKNNYDKEIFNGDSGFIQSINKEEKTLIVVFKKQVVIYDFSDLDELMLAYAVTVHKSQGSEYPIVVMPITMGHYVMLKRNLIYTGITRAKNLCVLLGQKQSLYLGVNTIDTTKRNTYLNNFLKEI